MRCRASMQPVSSRVGNGPYPYGWLGRPGSGFWKSRTSHLSLDVFAETASSFPVCSTRSQRKPFCLERYPVLTVALAGSRYGIRPVCMFSGSRNSILIQPKWHVSILRSHAQHPKYLSSTHRFSSSSARSAATTLM